LVKVANFQGWNGVADQVKQIWAISVGCFSLLPQLVENGFHPSRHLLHDCGQIPDT